MTYLIYERNVQYYDDYKYHPHTDFFGTALEFQNLGSAKTYLDKIAEYDGHGIWVTNSARYYIRKARNLDKVRADGCERRQQTINQIAGMIAHNIEHLGERPPLE